MTSDDRLRQFESDLRALRPEPPSDGVVERIAQRLPRHRLADRVLAGTLAMASLAACLIVGLLLTATAPPATPAQVSVPPDTPTLANPQPLFARADLPTNN